MDNSTAAGHPGVAVDTHFQEEMGRLQGGEVSALFEGQEEEAGGRRAGVQPLAGRRARQEDHSPVGDRRDQALLPRLQAALDRHHHCWADAVEGAEWTRSVPPREETGERQNLVFGEVVTRDARYILDGCQEFLRHTDESDIINSSADIKTPARISDC